MIERLELLDEKIGKLIENMKAMRGEITRLRKENEELKGQLNDAAGLAEKNTQLQADVETMLEDLSERENKENVVRNKLKTIMDRIDDLEGEMDQITGPQDE